MAKNGISLDESLEEYIISKTLKENGIKRGINREIIKDLYYLINYGNISKDEIYEYLRDLYITRDELELISICKNKFDVLMRKKLLFEFGNAVDSYTNDEMIKMMNLYHISEEEIETIFLDLYPKFKNSILLQPKQEEAKQWQKIKEIILKWSELSEEEKKHLRSENPDEYLLIEDSAKKIQIFKKGLTHSSSQTDTEKDESILDLMRKAVGKQVGENSKTRNNLNTNSKGEHSI